MNYVGWRLISLPFSAFSMGRSPVGWNKVDSIQFTSLWSSAVPINSTVVGFDDLVLTSKQVFCRFFEKLIKKLSFVNIAPFKYYLPASTNVSWDINVQRVLTTGSDTFTVTSTGALPSNTALTFTPTSFTINGTIIIFPLIKCRKFNFIFQLEIFGQLQCRSWNPLYNLYRNSQRQRQYHHLSQSRHYSTNCNENQYNKNQTFCSY
jgi:hypothetical protein